MNYTDLIELHLIGGPYDGDTIKVRPEMNSRFFLARNGRQEWYMTYSRGKAYYLAPSGGKQ